MLEAFGERRQNHPSVNQQTARGACVAADKTRDDNKSGDHLAGSSCEVPIAQDADSEDRYWRGHWDLSKIPQRKMFLEFVETVEGY